jgi:hypothetical protein
MRTTALRPGDKWNNATDTRTIVSVTPNAPEATLTGRLIPSGYDRIVIDTPDGRTAVLLPSSARWIRKDDGTVARTS